ncbi:MAG: sigma 54-interacting transcriptional regulator [Pirellulaceae bacterium]
MLLNAIEEKTFWPAGSDQPTRSEFQLLGGINRSLALEVQAGRFRYDLLARINLSESTAQRQSSRPSPMVRSRNCSYFRMRPMRLTSPPRP